MKTRRDSRIYSAIVPLVIFVITFALVAVIVAMRPPFLEPKFYRQTVDGVECIVYDAYREGGISCNWERYNKEHP